MRPWRALPDRLTLRIRVLGRESLASEAGPTGKGTAWTLKERFWGPGEAGGELDALPEAKAAGMADAAEPPPTAAGATLPRSRAAPALAWHEGSAGVKGRGFWRDGLPGICRLQSGGLSAAAGWGDAGSAEEFGSGKSAGGSVACQVMRGPIWLATMGHTSEADAFKLVRKREGRDRKGAESGPGEAAASQAATASAAQAATAASSQAGVASASQAATADASVPPPTAQEPAAEESAEGVSASSHEDHEEEESSDAGEAVTLGVALFRSRWDAEQRTMASLDGGSASPPAAAAGNPVDLRCGWCGRAQGQPDLLGVPAAEPRAVALRRCGRSRAAYYCADTACQRRDWTEGGFRHRCLPRAQRTPGKQRWGDCELATVFVPALVAPVADVADCEAVAPATALDRPVPPPTPAEPAGPAGEAGYLRAELPSVADSSFPMPLVFGHAAEALPRRPTEPELTTNTLAMHVLPRWLATWPALAAAARPSARETLVVLRADSGLPVVPVRAAAAERPAGAAEPAAASGGRGFEACEPEAAALLGVEACPQSALAEGLVAEPVRATSMPLAELCRRLGLPLPPPLPPWLEGLVVAVRLDPMLTAEEAQAARDAPPA